MTAISRSVPDPAIEPTIEVPRGAAILGVGVRGLYAAAARGEIPVIRVGRTVRIPTAQFLAQFGLAGTPPEAA